ncbi:MAG: hypothetical protein BWY70_00133 [Bacteroidetes bacterium ADurb.Bin408]|nr:MAG: hypothetical protein BWY70_00133 [Bacteroidetes bacterium ADurb.Bin408]
MKKNLLLIFAAVAMACSTVSAQQDTLEAWIFPDGSADSLVDVAISLNASRFISCEYGTAGPALVIDYTTNGSLGSPDKSAKVVGLENGADSVYWLIKFKSTGYQNLKLYSKQSSGGTNPGPKTFKVQYKLPGTSTWVDLPNGTVTCANDWTTGVLNGVDLPAACENQGSNVSIRWIQTTNLDINDAPVLATGISKIDDIVITGEIISGINETNGNDLNIYPNPNTGNFSIETGDNVNQIKIYNLIGQCVYENNQVVKELIYFRSFEKGVYFINMYNENALISTSKLIVK